MLPSERIEQLKHAGILNYIEAYLDEQHNKRYGSPRRFKKPSLREHLLRMITANKIVSHSELLKRMWREGNSKEIIAELYNLINEKIIEEFIMEGTKARFYQLVEDQT